MIEIPSLILTWILDGVDSANSAGTDWTEITGINLVVWVFTPECSIDTPPFWIGSPPETVDMITFLVLLSFKIIGWSVLDFGGMLIGYDVLTVLYSDVTTVFTHDELSLLMLGVPKNVPKWLFIVILLRSTSFVSELEVTVLVMLEWVVFTDTNEFIELEG